MVAAAAAAGEGPAGAGTPGRYTALTGPPDTGRPICLLAPATADVGREARATPPSTSYLASATAAAAAVPDARRTGAAPSLGDAGLDAGRLPAGLPAAELCALPLPRPLDDMATTTTETRQKECWAALLLRAHAVRGERGKESATRRRETEQQTSATRSFASAEQTRCPRSSHGRASQKQKRSQRPPLLLSHCSSAATVPVRLAALTLVQRRTRRITHSSMRFDCCSPCSSGVVRQRWRWESLGGGGFIAVFRPFDSSAAKRRTGSVGRTSRETTANRAALCPHHPIQPHTRTDSTRTHTPHTSADMTAESFKEKGNEVRTTQQTTAANRGERSGLMRSELSQTAHLSALSFSCVSARCARPQFFKKGDYERVSQTMLCAWQLAASAGLAAGAAVPLALLSPRLLVTAGSAGCCRYSAADPSAREAALSTAGSSSRTAPARGGAPGSQLRQLSHCDSLTAAASQQPRASTRSPQAAWPLPFHQLHRIPPQPC